MAQTNASFSDLLARAIDRIAFLENKTKQIVYDELGYALGRQGGSAIQYWIYNKRVPARLEDIENLARAIARRGGWENENDLRRFLENCSHPAVDLLCRQVFPDDSTLARADAYTETGLPPEASFIVGPPILNPRQFFGRKRELKRIFAAINSRVMQNVAVSGLSRSGKTSLLHYLQRITRTPAAALRPNQFTEWLHQPQTYRWVYIDFQDPRVCTREGFMTFLLRQLNFPVPGQIDLVQFVDIICRYLVNPTVILLDEIQIAMANPEFTQSFWWGLRSLASNLTEGKLAFVIASQKTSWVSPADSSKPSPFLNIFGHLVNLEPLSEEEALQLIQSSPLPFSQADSLWILEKSGCWPALLQILCSTRLVSLEEGVQGDSWKSDGLANIEPYRYLLDAP